jgi:SM-20-related protein
MTTKFDVLIDCFIENKIGIADQFMSADMCKNLKNNLLALLADNKLKDAGIGNNAIVKKDKLFRTDKIYWLDRSHDNIFENSFLDMMDDFVLHLNATCYAGITGYEFHYAVYEPGSFYAKHLDQFANNNSRKYSMILYLNEAWQTGDGGELCVHHANGLQYISPTNGKGVFFASNIIEHEVLLSHKQRMSITGWLKVG